MHILIKGNWLQHRLSILLQNNKYARGWKSGDIKSKTIDTVSASLNPL